MLIFAPIGTGAVIGIMMIVSTIVLKKSGTSKFLSYIPGIIGALAACYFFYLGFFQVRGFEGAAYGLLSITVLVFSVITIVMAGKRRVGN